MMALRLRLVLGGRGSATGEIFLYGFKPVFQTPFAGQAEAEVVYAGGTQTKVCSVVSTGATAVPATCSTSTSGNALQPGQQFQMRCSMGFNAVGSLEC